MGKPIKTSLPVYDDFGNHIAIPPNKRTFERKQGCWNCVSFDCSEMYLKRVQDMFRRDVGTEVERGLSLQAATQKASATRSMLIDKAGIFGFCLKGKVEGDFVACKHLCIDGWSGRVGVTGSFTPGEKWDEPVAAVYEDLGDKIANGDIVDPSGNKVTGDAPDAPPERKPLIITGK